MKSPPACLFAEVRVRNSSDLRLQELDAATAAAGDPAPAAPSTVASPTAKSLGTPRGGRGRRGAPPSGDAPIELQVVGVAGPSGTKGKERATSRSSGPNNPGKKRKSDSVPAVASKRAKAVAGIPPAHVRLDTSTNLQPLPGTTPPGMARLRHASGKTMARMLLC